MLLLGVFLGISQPAVAPIGELEFTNPALTSHLTSQEFAGQEFEADLDLRSLAVQLAVERQIEPSTMLATLDCENQSWNPTQQSNIRYAFSDPKRGIVKGERERSYGLAMVHLPDHPDISYEEAIDPVFALTYMADEFAAGRASQWYCYPY